jgi:hypothetical protein
MRIQASPVAALVLIGVILSSPAAQAEKLKGIYSGSGGFSAEVHRVLFIEFAADGSALLQQKWHDKDPQTWHARWKQDGKNVTLTYEPAKDGVTPSPLVFTFKHGTLTATSWDATTLGVLGPPTLAPFGGKNPQGGSVATCQGFDTQDPRRDCTTWSSNR